MALFNQNNYKALSLGNGDWALVCRSLSGVGGIEWGDASGPTKGWRWDGGREWDSQGGALLWTLIQLSAVAGLGHAGKSLKSGGMGWAVSNPCPIHPICSQALTMSESIYLFCALGLCLCPDESHGSHQPPHLPQGRDHPPCMPAPGPGCPQPSEASSETSRTGAAI